MSIEKMVNEYLIEKENEKKAKERKDFLKKSILEYAKDNNFFETLEHNITIEEKTQKRLDTKALYTDFPDIKKEYEKITSYKDITIVFKAIEKTA